MEAHLWFSFSLVVVVQVRLSVCCSLPNCYGSLVACALFKSSCRAYRLALFTLLTYIPLRMCRRLLSYANLVVGNEDEFRALADRASLLVSSECESIASVARKVAALEYISPGNQFKPCRISDFQGFSHRFLFFFICK